MATRNPDPASPFTAKALLVGVVACVCVSVGSAYASMWIKGSFMAKGTSVPGAVFLLFVLTAFLNPLLNRIHPRIGLSHHELLVVFIMMAMASPIPTVLTSRLIGQFTIPYYFGTPENRWETLILPHIPHWLMQQDMDLLDPFYVGAGSGEEIQWLAWMPVLLVWIPIVAAVFLAMIASMVILRKQWIVHERLIYPLMQVPLAMAEPPRPGEFLSPIFKNPVMWMGFAIPALYGSLHGLYSYFPAVVPVAQDVDPFQMTTEVFRGVTDLYLCLRFNILGFFYFLKTDVAFSLWFFNLLLYGVRGLFGVLGVAMHDPTARIHVVEDTILAHQSTGAMLALFLGGLWVARDHLRGVFRKAFTGDRAIDDSDEVLSYRAAVILLLVSSAAILAWLWLAGLPLWVGLALLFLAATLLVGYARVIAESGLSDGAPPVSPIGVLVAGVGTSAIGTQGLVILMTATFWTEGRSFVITSCANALRLGEEIGQGKRPLFWTLLLALVVALVASVWTIMSLSHDYGNLNLKIRSGGGYEYAESLIRTPVMPNMWAWINTGIGAAIMAALTIARRFYPWWPLHPIGYAIGPINVMDALWFNLFLAWLIKILVLKYGGVKLYRATRPFFMGLILGSFVPAGLFLIIDHFTGMVGNVIFWG